MKTHTTNVGKIIYSLIFIFAIIIYYNNYPGGYSSDSISHIRRIIFNSYSTTKPLAYDFIWKNLFYLSKNIFIFFYIQIFFYIYSIFLLSTLFRGNFKIFFIIFFLFFPIFFGLINTLWTISLSLIIINFSIYFYFKIDEIRFSKYILFILIFFLTLIRWENFYYTAVFYILYKCHKGHDFFSFKKNIKLCFFGIFFSLCFFLINISITYSVINKLPFAFDQNKKATCCNSVILLHLSGMMNKN